MKPFNLEEALAGKPVQTRDGQLVKIGAYNPDATKTHRVVGWIEGNVSSWYENGSYVNDEVHIRDLFMAPETKVVWVLLFAYDKYLYSQVYKTEEMAKEKSEGLNYSYTNLGVHKITIKV